MKTTRVVLENAQDAATVVIYDELTRQPWGELRIRRELNPGVLVIEGRRVGQTTWAPMVNLTAIGGQLGVRHWFKGGGPDAVTEAPTK